MFPLLHSRNGDRFRVTGMYLTKVEWEGGVGDGREAEYGGGGEFERGKERFFEHVKH